MSVKYDRHLNHCRSLRRSNFSSASAQSPSLHQPELLQSCHPDTSGQVLCVFALLHLLPRQLVLGALGRGRL